MRNPVWRPPQWASPRAAAVTHHILAGVRPPVTVLETDVTNVPWMLPEEAGEELRAELAAIFGGLLGLTLPPGSHLVPGSIATKRRNFCPDWLAVGEGRILAMVDLKRRFTSLNWQCCCATHGHGSQLSYYRRACWVDGESGWHLSDDLRSLIVSPCGRWGSLRGRATPPDAQEVQDEYDRARQRWSIASYATVLKELGTGTPGAEFLARVMAAADDRVAEIVPTAGQGLWNSHWLTTRSGRVWGIGGLRRRPAAYPADGASVDHLPLPLCGSLRDVDGGPRRHQLLQLSSASVKRDPATVRASLNQILDAA